ncbi:hypothetical protein RND81_12G199500 [Saponaria officinalis]|uniref:Uncharacterized protein n=1 Tax=Saponaria officinalis TaxID=3572 RepID=A0AAW1HCX8_SAPOF
MCAFVFWVLAFTFFIFCSFCYKVTKLRGVSKFRDCSSPEKEKEKIMVHTINGEKGGFVYGEFFTINLSNGEIEELPYVLAGGDQGYNSMVSIGSTVYVVGGLSLAVGERGTIKPPNSRTDSKKGILYHQGMSFIDLNSSDDDDSGWKSAPCQHDAHLCYTAAVSLGGKIYSFSHSAYAGIFDPVSQQWETLLPPPEVGSFQIYSGKDVIADPDNNRLLVFFGQYFAYYPDDNRWESNLNLDSSSSSLPWSSKRVLLLLAEGGLFISYVPKHPTLFEVYDSVTHQWLKVRFTSDVPYSLGRIKFEAMVYLGNDLICLFVHLPTLDDNITYVRACKFRFVRSPTYLLFTWFPPHTYRLNSPCAIVAGYLPIWVVDIFHFSSHPPTL